MNEEKEEMMYEKSGENNDAIENEFSEGPLTEAEREKEELPSEETGTAVETEEMVSSEEGVQYSTGKSKHETALDLVHEAKNVVAQTDEQMQACKVLLSDDLEAYESAKSELYATSLEKSEALLEKIGKVPETKEAEGDFVLFEPREEVAPIEIKDISSGKFTGAVSALLVGTATLFALLFTASMKLDLALTLDQLPSMETLSPLFAWFSIPFTGNADLNIGATVVVLSVLIVMSIVYMVRVKLKASENLRFATQQLEDAQAYSEAKGDCKSEMEKVDTHINESIRAMNLYQVLLTEQNGTLERILYIEGDKDPEALHPNSLAAVMDTRKLLDAIHLLMETPMSEEGKLSPKRALVLQRTEEKAEEFIDSLY